MSDITLRSFSMADPEVLTRWYHEDRHGIETFMGVEIPNEIASTMAFNLLLEKQQRGTAVFRMVYRDDEAIGVALVTYLSHEDRSGLASCYVAKDQRRYSLDVLRTSEREAKNMGFRGFLLAIDPNNTRALNLWKRLGYKTPNHLTLVKEFS
jgi:ribosomal protein S18 acetylase RimI-like enzyme